MARATELLDRLEGATSLAIVCHDNPDPDCIASALALAHVAATAAVDEIAIVYGGDISHQQNRAFVNALDVELDAVEDVDLAAYDLVAFVDHDDARTRSALPSGTHVDVVIDHHPSAESTEAPFVDVREEYGATSSILVDYLRELDVDVTARLASALVFALHRQCLDYVRHPTPHEYEAARYVCPTMDMALIESMYGTAFSATTLDAIGAAIHNRRIRGSTLVTAVEGTTERDALAQAADYLLNLEGISTVLVYGIVGELIQVSARSVDSRVNVGAVLRTAFGDVGSAGGHRDRAGAQIPLGIFADRTNESDELFRLVSTRVVDRIFDTMHLEGESELETA